jgi:hypothetical protein
MLRVGIADVTNQIRQFLFTASGRKMGCLGFIRDNEFRSSVNDLLAEGEERSFFRHDLRWDTSLLRIQANTDK